jgi:hypothetical protein
MLRKFCSALLSPAFWMILARDPELADVVEQAARPVSSISTGFMPSSRAISMAMKATLRLCCSRVSVCWLRMRCRPSSPGVRQTGGGAAHHLRGIGQAFVRFEVEGAKGVAKI